MNMLSEYRDARRAEEIARLRRVLALRAASADGMSQREIACALEISQPAVSQQLSAAQGLDRVDAATLVEAAGPVLRGLAESHGYTRLGVFGSVARQEAGPDSDIDLIIQSPQGTSSFGFVRFKELIERVLGREVDLVDYGGLTPLDDDIRRETVLL